MGKNYFKVHQGVVLAPQSGEPASPTDGDMYFDSVLNKFRGRQGGSFKDLIGDSGGVKNFLDDDSSNFEAGVGSWEVKANTIPDALPEITPGGTPNGGFTFTRTTTASEVLRDNGSGKLTKPAADVQGHSIRVPFTISNDQRGKEMDVPFIFKTGSGYVNNYYRSFVIHPGTSTRINVLTNGGDGSIPVSTSNGTNFVGRMTSIDDADLDYELVIHATSTDATGFDLFLDEVGISPKFFVNVPVVTSPEKYTPTFGGFGTVTAIDVEFSQVGKFLFIQGTFTIGTTEANPATMSLPPGLTIATVQVNQPIGHAYRETGSAAAEARVIANTGNAFVEFTPRGLASPTIPNTGNNFLDTGETCSFEIGPIPIEEFDSGAILSTTQADALIIRVQGDQSSTTHTASNTWQRIDYTETVDTHNTFASNIFTAPKDMAIAVAATCSFDASPNGVRNIRISVNGGDTKRGVKQIGSSVGSLIISVFSVLDLLEGDTVIIEAFQSSGGNLGYTSGSSFSLSMFSIPDFSFFGVTGVNEFFDAQSSLKVPSGTNHYLLMTGNSIVLPPGSFTVHATVEYTPAASTSYTNSELIVAAANGADNGTPPSVFSSLAGVTLDAGVETIGGLNISSVAVLNKFFMYTPVRYTLTQQQTLFVVPLVGAVNFANARVKTNIYIERLV